MTIELARLAVRYAKAATPLGTDNQKPQRPNREMTPDEVAAAMERMRASQKIMEIRSPALQDGCTMDEVQKYGRSVAAKGAGNCVEQCAAAALYLQGQANCPPVRFGST